MKPVLQQLHDRLGPEGAVRYLAKLGGYIEVPPDINTFLEDEYFMGKRLGGGGLWSVWKDVLMQIFPHALYSPYKEVVFTGSIGSGKSTACLGSETLVDLLDGRSLPIKRISEEFDGKEFWILAYDEGSKRWTPAKAKNCRKTGFKAVYEIVLDTGDSFKATADHTFLDRKGNWIRTDQLKPGQSLRSYSRTRSKSGYDSVFCHDENRYRALYRLVSEWKIGKIPDGWVVHHKNFVQCDNRPENLVACTKGGHASYHQSEHLKFREIRLDGIRKFLNDPVRRETWMHNLRASMSSEKVRAKLSAAQKDRFSNPQERTRLLEVGRRASRETRSEAQKRRLKTDEDRAKLASRVNTPEAEAKARAYTTSEENRLRLSHSMHRNWKENYEKRKAGQNTPELKAARSLVAKRRNEDYWSLDSMLGRLNTHLLAEQPISKFHGIKKLVSEIGSLEEVEIRARNHNHKVVSVTFAGYEDVYCMEVPKYHNFPLTCGVVSHNCAAGILYDLCKMLYLKNPAITFGLKGGGKEIVIQFQGSTMSQVKKTTWDEFQSMLLSSPFFIDQIKATRKKERSLIVLPHRIVAYNGSRGDHPMGSDVVMACLSELNFMNKVKNQAMDNYVHVKRRMVSRFERGARLDPPGKIWMDSSRKDESGFLEVYIRTLKAQDMKRKAENEDYVPRNIVISKAIWECKMSAGVEYRKWFPVFIGDEKKLPRILEGPPGTSFGYPEEQVIMVPEDFKEDFEFDLVGSLRDLAGVATWSGSKYLSEPVVRQCARLDNPSGQPEEDRDRNVIRLDPTDKNDQLIKHINLKMLPKGFPYFIHFDLAKGKADGDRIGVAMSRCLGEIGVDRAGRHMSDSHIIRDFQFQTNLAIAVAGQDGLEVPLSRFRNFVVHLQEEGYDIGGVSADNNQSQDLLSECREGGLRAEKITTDSSVGRPICDHFKNALSEHRWSGPNHEILIRELINLQDMGDYIDHPEITGLTGGDRPSKDIADCVMASVWNAKQKAAGGKALSAMDDFFDVVTQQIEKPSGAREVLKSSVKNAMKRSRPGGRGSGGYYR